MQKYKQDTITISTVGIYDKRTFQKVFEGKTFEDNEKKAEKHILNVYLNGLSENEIPTEKDNYIARVDGVEKYKLTCNMEDFINLCFEKGTAEKIEG